MEGMNVASRYAQSLIELTEETNVTDAVLKDMKSLLATTADNRDFQLFLTSPLIKSDKKSKVFDSLFTDFQELSIRFIHLLAQHNRERYLPLIAKDFIDKVNSTRGIVPMTITSAVTLDPKVKETILAKLNDRIKGSVELTEEVDESIIGGFIARMGDTRIDASVSNQLKEMEKRLMK